MNDADNVSPITTRAGRQIYLPRRVLLATFSGNPTTAIKTVRFRVPVPDSRLHWKFTVLGVGLDQYAAAPGRSILAGRNLTIWVCTLEDNTATGIKPEPVTNIVGTQAAPAKFPSNQLGNYDTSLGGFSLENDGSACDGLQGEITIPIQGGGPIGALYLQARYQPNVGSILPLPQWEEIVADCKVRLDGKAADA